MRRLPSLLLLLAAAVPARAQNIPPRLDAALLRAQDTLADSFARSLPLPSASAGVSYAFDVETGNFSRQPSTFGQVYLDRADTIGAKRLNVQFLYEYAKLDELSGEDAGHLRDPTPIYVPGKAAALRFANLDLKAVQHQFLFAVTWAQRGTLGHRARLGHHREHHRRHRGAGPQPVRPVAPPGFFDFPRCRTQNLLLCASDQSVRGGTAPLFGLSGARPDYYDFSLGGRGAVWRDTVFAFVNVVLPLNDGFVRTDPIPVIGVEATF